jgi:hypothetical protein
LTPEARIGTSSVSTNPANIIPQTILGNVHLDNKVKTVWIKERHLRAVWYSLVDMLTFTRWAFKAGWWTQINEQLRAQEITWQRWWAHGWILIYHRDGVEGGSPIELASDDDSTTGNAGSDREEETFAVPLRRINEAEQADQWLEICPCPGRPWGQLYIFED